jgi:hypothetical protein
VAVCVDLTAGTAVFYIDGAVSKTWTSAEKNDNLTGTIKYPENVGDNHLAIGNVLEGSADTFYGLLDELKV